MSFYCIKSPLHNGHNEELKESSHCKHGQFCLESFRASGLANSMLAMNDLHFAQKANTNLLEG